MKIVTALVAAATMAVALPAAVSAAPWQSINQRQANLYHRIDVGVRNGSLTRAESSQLRTRFANLRRLEYRYRHNGLNRSERADLDRRFDALSRSIRTERHDRQHRWHR